MAVLDLSPFNTILKRLESVTSRLEAGTGITSTSSSSGAAQSGDPAIAVEWDAFCQQYLTTVQEAAKSLNVTEVTEATDRFVEGTKLLRALFAATGGSKKPKDEDWAKILAPVMDLGKKATGACDNRSDYFHNQKAAAAAISIATLVTATSPPAHVKNVVEEMDFHAIKVMKKQVPAETTWIKAMKEFVTKTGGFCDDNCKMGLSWNINGKEAVEYFGDGAALAPSAQKGAGKGKGAPAPPPGGFAKPPPQEESAPKSGGGGGGMADVMAAINSGNVTAGLKKVTADMKTKNRSPDDVAPVVAPKKPVAAAPTAKSTGKGPRGPPLKELQKGTNWIIENHENDGNISIEELEQKHLVLVINCKNCTVRLPSKVKNVCIDGCLKVNLVCDDVISTVELVNSDRCQVQTTGKVNSFAIDKCNGVNVFLSKQSLEADIVSSKSSEMNVTIPDPDGEEGDQIEMPIPEQFVTKLVGPKKLQTTVSDLYSS
jgi:adenylyl cyclase-associated protein